MARQHGKRLRMRGSRGKCLGLGRESLEGAGVHRHCRRRLGLLSIGCAGIGRNGLRRLRERLERLRVGRKRLEGLRIGGKRRQGGRILGKGRKRWITRERAKIGVVDHHFECIGLHELGHGRVAKRHVAFADLA